MVMTRRTGTKEADLSGVVDEHVKVLWQTERVTSQRNRHDDVTDGDTDSDASDNSATLFDIHQKLHISTMVPYTFITSNTFLKLSCKTDVGSIYFISYLAKVSIAC